MWYTTSRYFENWDMLQRTVFHLSNTKNPPSLEPRKNPSTFHYIIGRILLLVYFNLHIIGSSFIPKQSPKQPGARAFAHKHGPFFRCSSFVSIQLGLGSSTDSWWWIMAQPLRQYALSTSSTVFPVFPCYVCYKTGSWHKSNQDAYWTISRMERNKGLQNTAQFMAFFGDKMNDTAISAQKQI